MSSSTHFLVGHFLTISCVFSNIQERTNWIFKSIPARARHRMFSRYFLRVTLDIDDFRNVTFAFPLLHYTNPCTDINITDASINTINMNVNNPFLCYTCSSSPQWLYPFARNMAMYLTYLIRTYSNEKRSILEISVAITASIFATWEALCKSWRTSETLRSLFFTVAVIQTTLKTRQSSWVLK